MICKNIREDYLQIFRIAGKQPHRVSFLGIFPTLFKNRGFRAVVLYRIGRCLRIRGHKILANIFEKLIQRLCYCEIATAAEIGPGFAVFHPFGLVVGTDVKAGKNFTLSMDVVVGGNIGKCRKDGSEQPIIGDDVNIASGSKIVGPVNIGNNCLIGANSVVITDISSNSVAAGVPARVIKRDGKKVSLLESNSELVDIISDLRRRVQELENRLK